MAARILRLSSTVPAVVLAAWLVVGLPLLLARSLHPAVTVALATPLAVVLVVVVLRLRPEPSDVDGRASIALLLTALVAVGFGVLAWTKSAEDVVVRRDPAVYAQTADRLADSGRLPIPADSAAFGDTPGLTYGSPGFYQREDPPVLVPQFMTGTAVALTPAGWWGGLRGITRGNAVIGALALLAVAGLAARLAGPWAAPLAALALALCYPDLHVARSAYSEPAAQLLLFGGLSMLVDARRALPNRLSELAHGLAGLVLGLGCLVRIDAVLELVALVPVLVVIVMTENRRGGTAASLGLATGVGLGVVDGFVLTKPYVDMLSTELVASALLAVVVAVGTWLVVRNRGRIRERVPWYPRLPTVVAAAFVLGAFGAYAVRPHLQHPRFDASEPVARDITDLQTRLGLPPSGPRTYAEQSMHWLAWWLGLTGLILGVVGLALLLRRSLRYARHPALPFALVAVTTTAVVVARPSITPDHPWADRRFVPVVLPALVVAATWLLLVLVAWVRRRFDLRAALVAAVAGVAALVVPAAVASAPLLLDQANRGELAAVRATCDALPDGAAVIVTGARGRNELPQVIRAGCDVPVAVAPETDAASTVARATAAAREQGRTVVVLGDTAAAVAAAADAQAERVVLLVTREDDRQLVQRPRRLEVLHLEFWLARPR